MGVDTNKLTTMAKNAPDLSANVGQSISSIDDALTELNSQKDAVQDGLCGTAETEARDIIDNTILPKWLSVQPTAYVVYGAGFGDIAWSDPGPAGNLSAWEIWYIADVPNPTPPFIPPTIPTPTILYPYTPTDYPDLDVLVSDYSFGNDQVTRPLIDGATYGIDGNITALNAGKSILQENQDKLDGIPDVYSRYSS
jgi:hypothetical protein